mgnify:CR=1 FL=1
MVHSKSERPVTPLGTLRSFTASGASLPAGVSHRSQKCRRRRFYGGTKYSFCACDRGGDDYTRSDEHATRLQAAYKRYAGQLLAAAGAAHDSATVDTLLAFGSNGRVYSVPVSALPGARGDGQPITTLIELEAGTQLLHYFAGAANAWLLLSSSGGYGFLATVENMISRQKAGKAFITVGEGEVVCKPSPANVPAPAGTVPSGLYLPATHVACVSATRRVLTFEITELKAMAGGGRGLMLMDLDKKDSLAGAAAYTRSVRIAGTFRDKEREEVLEIRTLNNARAARGRKGKDGSFVFKPVAVERIE